MTDIVLPEIDGPELALTLDQRRPGIKVLFMSGHSAEMAARTRLLPPGAPMLEKPFNATELAIAVRSALDSDV